ncbi:MAG: substrate-binding domain-containing protein [Firmicutes bacterium]|nr:substrate-binding domain-containing protein [Bacillota bacterium]
MISGRKLNGKYLAVLSIIIVFLSMAAGCRTNAPAGSSGSPAITRSPAAADLSISKAPAGSAADVILATTTSTQDSGLLDVLVPLFQKKTGYRVKTIAVGTGQALKMGERGEADVLLVHAPDAEKELVAAGAAVGRRLVMHNDFVLAGPAEDPADVKGVRTAVEALRKIAASEAVFVSRGDESGTHKMELSLWKAAGITPRGRWYLQSGTGMGQTLGIASDKGGYTLTDRATYLATRKNHRLSVVLEGDPSLLNIYHVILVNPARFGKVNARGAASFADFLLSSEAQGIIGMFGVDLYNEPLFFPDAGKTEEQLAEGR